MSMRVRRWSALQFADPVARLISLREIENMPELAQADERVRRLRTNGLRPIREGRIAYLFAVGMSTLFGVNFEVAIEEAEDFDFVLRTAIGEEVNFIPVQLKELAPEDLNPDQTLEELFDGLQHRPPSNTVLLIHLNRRGQIDYARLAACNAPYGEVWFLWASDSDQNEWTIYGSILGTTTVKSFPYPTKLRT
jgi:hypothetical protein